MSLNVAARSLYRSGYVDLDESSPSSNVGVAIPSAAAQGEAAEDFQKVPGPSRSARLCHTVQQYLPRRNNGSSSRVTLTPPQRVIRFLPGHAREAEGGRRAPFEIRSGGKASALLDVPNVVCNQKYSVVSFVPSVVVQQFKFFFNFFFLALALSQTVPVLQVGPLFTYIMPLAFVLTCTLLKEAADDISRYRRDSQANNEKFRRLDMRSGVIKPVRSADIKVGDVIEVESDQRVPADMVFLTGRGGQTFVRTDQLDGETDWKPRKAVACLQRPQNECDLTEIDAACRVEGPRREIYSFQGRFTINGQPPEALSLENTLWANCVVTSGPVRGLVIYTGAETRAAMNIEQGTAKVCKLDREVDVHAQVCFVFLLLLSVGLTVCKGLEGQWYIYLFRYLVLLSYIIPISLKVNLDLAKTLYTVQVGRDEAIPGTIARTSNILEDLGQIDYVLTDKTGTLTKNDMVFKKLRIATGEYSDVEAATEMRQAVARVLRRVRPTSASASPGTAASGSQGSTLRRYFPSVSRQMDSASTLTSGIMALALCHNVTPVVQGAEEWSLQAASPDEVALVKFAAQCGVKLTHRDEHSMVLSFPFCGGSGSASAASPKQRSVAQGAVTSTWDILQCFPFSSETKRMGIVVRERQSGELVLLVKGADSVMQPRVRRVGASWLAEEVDSYARLGLRTLVVGMKRLTPDDFEAWQGRYAAALAIMDGSRDRQVSACITNLESTVGGSALELLALTGVEDRLQDRVSETIEKLRHAGVKVWMLTGDKVETAICIAISTALKSRANDLFVMDSRDIPGAREALAKIREFAAGYVANTVLVIDGSVLSYLLLDQGSTETFVRSVESAPAVVCCRCTPTQKTQVVRAIAKYAGGKGTKRTLAIGDGGNDVGMIRAAHVGVGIVGKEGMQASMAADFSILKFRYLLRLMLWTGRNCYEQSARMSLFVLHRGLIIAVIQVIFSLTFYFIALPIFQGWLMIGYSTYYTFAPVFALCLHTELPERTVFMFPELYQALRSGNRMSVKLFLGWVLKSVYQGAVIMVLAIWLFDDRLVNIVSVAFTCLILAELLNVASVVHPHWHPLMVVAELLTLVVYTYSMFILRSYFSISSITSFAFVWRVLVIVAAACLPVYFFEALQRCCHPDQHEKLVASPAQQQGLFADRGDGGRLLRDDDSRSIDSLDDVDGRGAYPSSRELEMASMKV